MVGLAKGAANHLGHKDDKPRTIVRQYREAGTYPGAVDVTSRGSNRIPTARFTVPRDAQRGQTIHLILEVEDAGTPPMTSYQRVVATVR